MFSVSVQTRQMLLSDYPIKVPASSHSDKYLTEASIIKGECGKKQKLVHSENVTNLRDRMMGNNQPEKTRQEG
jgi:hypothetical protein